MVVSLLDDSGDVVATTTTNAAGQYSFNQHSGITTGSYTVSITLKNGDKLTTPTPIIISNGNQSVKGVNFLMPKPAAPVVASVAPPVVRPISAPRS